MKTNRFPKTKILNQAKADEREGYFFAAAAGYRAAGNAESAARCDAMKRMNDAQTARRAEALDTPAPEERVRVPGPITGGHSPILGTASTPPMQGAEKPIARYRELCGMSTHDLLALAPYYRDRQGAIWAAIHREYGQETMDALARSAPSPTRHALTGAEAVDLLSDIRSLLWREIATDPQQPDTFDPDKARDIETLDAIADALEEAGLAPQDWAEYQDIALAPTAPSQTLALHKPAAEKDAFEAGFRAGYETGSDAAHAMRDGHPAKRGHFAVAQEAAWGEFAPKAYDAWMESEHYLRSPDRGFVVEVQPEGGAR